MAGRVRGWVRARDGIQHQSINACMGKSLKDDGAAQCRHKHGPHQYSSSTAAEREGEGQKKLFRIGWLPGHGDERERFTHFISLHVDIATAD